MIQGYVNSATEKGSRPYQEDRFVVIRHETREEKGWLLAVMDGHGGSEVAAFCEENLSIYFNNLSASVFEYSDTALENMLKDIISELNEKTKHMYCGSTVSMAYISETREKAYVAILGDSPVIILNDRGSFIISPEHNARNNIAEREAAIKRGATYSDGYLRDQNMNHRLQLTRALGDLSLDKFLNREPQIYSVNLGLKSFVVVMSDGVVDPGHNNKNGEAIPGYLASIISNGGTATDLVNDALKRQTGDNVTAVLWKQPKE